MLAGVVVAALPATLLQRYLPPQVQAEGLSGSIWHGSTAHLTVLGRPAGALEWRLHPWWLLRGTVAADLHWVKGGVVLDGAALATRASLELHDVSGGGPLHDLADLTTAGAWSGTLLLAIRAASTDYVHLLQAVGNVNVTALASAQVAAGADLGNYRLTLTPQSVAADGSITATINDLGGPLKAQGEVHYSAQEHTGMVSGSLMETAVTAAPLQEQLANLAQMRPRDNQGRIPVDLEFAL